MRKIILLLTVFSVLTLSSCRAEDSLVEKYYNNHLDTIDGYDKAEIITKTIFSYADSETELPSYLYIDNTINKSCVANGENDPNAFEEYSTTCMAIFGQYNGNDSGFVPYPTENGVYAIHPVYQEINYQDLIMGLLTDEDIVEGDDENEVYIRKTVNFNELGSELQDKVSQGFDVPYPEVPVVLNVIYDISEELFTIMTIDNLDVMQLVYQENFGMEFTLDAYYIEITTTEYTDELNFLIPSTGTEADDHVNYFDDGDFYGYYNLNVDESIEGSLEYSEDQDIIKITIPVGGIYNLVYVNGNYEQSILFGLYSIDFEFEGEGVIGDPDHDLSNTYLYAGEYYIILFSHNVASGYKLHLQKVG